MIDARARYRAAARRLRNAGLGVLAAARLPPACCVLVSFPHEIHYCRRKCHSVTSLLFLRNIFLFSTHQNINGAGVAQLVQWLSHGLGFSLLAIVTDRPPEAHPSPYSVGARDLTPGVNGPGRDVSHSSAAGAEREGVCVELWRVMSLYEPPGL
jgi:hypothetical protein